MMTVFAKFDQISVEEIAARGRDALQLLNDGREFLSRPQAHETVDRIGRKLVDLHKLTTDELVRQECIYLVVRIVGERRREALAEPLVRMLNEHRKEERTIAKHILSKIDARSRSSAGQLMGAGSFPEGSYFDRYLSFSELRLEFYDFPFPDELSGN